MQAVSGINFENLRQLQQNFAFGYDVDELGNGTSQERIRKIARQFESMLLETLLKSMETPADGDEKMPGSGSFSDMRLMFLNQHLVNNGGLGYWQQIEQQILEKYRQNQPQQAESAFTIAPASRREGDFTLVPPAGGEISSRFGWRNDPIDGSVRHHNGIDLAMESGSEVRSVGDGRVTFSGWREGYGYLVEIEHQGGLKTIYAHNSKLLVGEGERVARGETISLSGSSGRSTGPHLHFEVRRDGRAIDPLELLPELAANAPLKRAETVSVKP